MRAKQIAKIILRRDKFREDDDLAGSVFRIQLIQNFEERLNLHVEVLEFSLLGECRHFF